MQTKWALTTAGILLSIAWPAHPQAKQTPTATPKPVASVEGHIICSEGNAPARGAAVHLHLLSRILSKEPNLPQNPPEAHTDFYGFYRFPSVAPGVYVISVNYPGYNDNYDLAGSILDRFDPDEQKKILGTFPQVAVGGSGGSVQDVVIHRGASISGHVTMDSGGIPGHNDFQVSAYLIATTLFGDTPDRDAHHAPINLDELATLDDRGFFRVAGLPPGSYKLQVHLNENFGVDDANTHGTIDVYAPETLDESQAEIITIGDGEERTDAEINIPTRLLHSISGTVTLGGEPVAKALVKFTRQADKNPCECGTQTNAEGDFRLDLIPPGAYTVESAVYAQQKQGLPRLVRTGKITVLVDNNDITGANIEVSAPTKSAAP